MLWKNSPSDFRMYVLYNFFRFYPPNSKLHFFCIPSPIPTSLYEFLIIETETLSPLVYIPTEKQTNKLHFYTII